MTYRFTLFIAGSTHRSTSALSNLRAVCERHIGDGFEIDVVDVLLDPQRAENDRVVATPTVIRDMPLPRRRIIGDLSEMAGLARALELPMHRPDTTTADGVQR